MLIYHHLQLNTNKYYYSQSKTFHKAFTNMDEHNVCKCNTVFWEIFIPFYFRPIRPHCHWANLRVCETVFPHISLLTQLHMYVWVNLKWSKSVCKSRKAKITLHTVLHAFISVPIMLQFLTKPDKSIMIKLST